MGTASALRLHHHAGEASVALCLPSACSVEGMGRWSCVSPNLLSTLRDAFLPHSTPCFPLDLPATDVQVCCSSLPPWGTDRSSHISREDYHLSHGGPPTQCGIGPSLVFTRTKQSSTQAPLRSWTQGKFTEGIPADPQADSSSVVGGSSSSSYQACGATSS